MNVYVFVTVYFRLIATNVWMTVNS